MSTESKSEHINYEELLRDLIGEDSFRAVLSAIEKRADEMVEKNKSDMTKNEREEFRAQCLRKAAWEKLCEYSVEASRPKAFTKSWWKDVLPRAGVYSIATVGAVAGTLALASRYSNRTAEVTTEGETETTETPTTEQHTDSPFRATARPSRRAASTENISAL